MQVQLSYDDQTRMARAGAALDSIVDELSGRTATEFDHCTVLVYGGLAVFRFRRKDGTPADCPIGSHALAVMATVPALCRSGVDLLLRRATTKAARCFLEQYGVLTGDGCWLPS